MHKQFLGPLVLAFQRRAHSGTPHIHTVFSNKSSFPITTLLAILFSNEMAVIVCVVKAHLISVLRYCWYRSVIPKVSRGRGRLFVGYAMHFINNDFVIPIYYVLLVNLNKWVKCFNSHSFILFDFIFEKTYIWCYSILKDTF